LFGFINASIALMASAEGAEAWSNISSEAYNTASLFAESVAQALWALDARLEKDGASAFLASAQQRRPN
jgi:hypothetical protein